MESSSSRLTQGSTSHNLPSSTTAPATAAVVSLFSVPACTPFFRSRSRFDGDDDARTGIGYDRRRTLRSDVVFRSLAHVPLVEPRILDSIPRLSSGDSARGPDRAANIR